MQFLDSDYLSRLEGLSLAVASLTDSRATGRRIGIGHGTSLEFADYRAYQPGDDTRYIDWNIYRRLGRLFLRLFRAESSLDIHILLDTSLSMDFGGVNKLDFGKGVAMALGYLALKSQDRVGVATFSSELNQVLVPHRGKGQISHLMRTLEEIQPAGSSDFLNPLCQHLEQGCRAGVVILISDFYSPSGYQDALRYLAGHHRHMVAIQIQDALEIQPEISGGASLRDLEFPDGKPVVVEESSLAVYQSNLEKFNTNLRSFCLDLGIGHIRALTSTPFEDLVLRLLEQGILE